jgi:hypothetical protein
MQFWEGLKLKEHLFVFYTNEVNVLRERVLRLLRGAGGYPPNVLQRFATYCTNPALVSPFISRGTPRQPA